ncbi:MAG TPA: sulfotransferase, partial [Myxococcota bacterium]|nr:sulfotransferase [Myxococcota bacterium]
MPHPLQPGPRPAWVRALNESCDPRWISLDPDALLAEAQRNTGLSDFGGDGFQQGLRVFLRAVEDEAQLHFVGRALTRGDVLNLLENRLRIADWRKRHPEIDAVR